MDTFCVLCASGPEYKPERDKEPEKKKLISAPIPAVRASARGGSASIIQRTGGGQVCSRRQRPREGGKMWCLRGTERSVICSLAGTQRTSGHSRVSRATKRSAQCTAAPRQRFTQLIQGFWFFHVVGLKEETSSPGPASPDLCLRADWSKRWRCTAPLTERSDSQLRSSVALAGISSTQSDGNQPTWPRVLPSQKPPSPMLRTGPEQVKSGEEEEEEEEGEEEEGDCELPSAALRRVCEEQF